MDRLGSFGGTLDISEYAFMMRVTLRNSLEKRGLKLPARAEMVGELAGLNQRQRSLLAYLREHESVSRAE